MPLSVPLKIQTHGVTRKPQHLHHHHHHHHHRLAHHYAHETKQVSPYAGGKTKPNFTTTAVWFAALCRTVNLREVATFFAWQLLTLALIVSAVLLWVTFFKFVIEPEQIVARMQYGALWGGALTTWLMTRQQMRRRCGAPVTLMADHAEIFATVSLAMVFSTNMAFAIHTPSPTPLRDLGFWLIPAQEEHSPWRPLSDLLTALLPISFMLQSYFMTRENRSRVLATFFRVASISYALRALTVALTSLPGPAPHCRSVDHPLYHAPRHWIDIVTRVGPLYGQFHSCGDLIFSGHMAYTTSAVLLYLRTLDRYCALRYARLRWTVGGCYLLVLAALCVSGRKHYTIDVVLGVVIATLVFFHFEHGWLPLSVMVAEPSAASSAQRYYARQRRWTRPVSYEDEHEDGYDLDGSSTTMTISTSSSGKSESEGEAEEGEERDSSFDLELGQQTERMLERELALELVEE